MEKSVRKRSIVVGGHKTSISLEDAFWSSVREIAGERGTTLSGIISLIDAGRERGNLSSAIRVFVLDYYREMAGGHSQHLRRSDEHAARYS